MGYPGCKLWEFRGVTPKIFVNMQLVSFEWIRNGTIMWKQVVEHHNCLIIDESHLNISSKTGYNDRNGTKHEHRTKQRLVWCQKFSETNAAKTGLLEKTGQMVTLKKDQSLSGWYIWHLVPFWPELEPEPDLKKNGRKSGQAELDIRYIPTSCGNVTTEFSWDWSFISRRFVLQCFDTVGWVM